MYSPKKLGAAHLGFSYEYLKVTFSFKDKVASDSDAINQRDAIHLGDVMHLVSMFIVQ
jgi:hypothetical protein